MVTVSQAAVTAGITKPGRGITDVGALIIETIFTAIFIVVIYAFRVITGWYSLSRQEAPW